MFSLKIPFIGANTGDSEDAQNGVELTVQSNLGTEESKVENIVEEKIYENSTSLKENSTNCLNNDLNTTTNTLMHQNPMHAGEDLENSVIEKMPTKSTNGEGRDADAEVQKSEAVVVASLNESDVQEKATTPQTTPERRMYTSATSVGKVLKNTNIQDNSPVTAITTTITNKQQSPVSSAGDVFEDAIGESEILVLSDNDGDEVNSAYIRKIATTTTTVTTATRPETLSQNNSFETIDLLTPDSCSDEQITTTTTPKLTSSTTVNKPETVARKGGCLETENDTSITVTTTIEDPKPTSPTTTKSNNKNNSITEQESESGRRTSASDEQAAKNNENNISATTVIQPTAIVLESADVEFKDCIYMPTSTEAVVTPALVMSETINTNNVLENVKNLETINANNFIEEVKHISFDSLIAKSDEHDINPTNTSAPAALLEEAVGFSYVVIPKTSSPLGHESGAKRKARASSPFAQHQLEANVTENVSPIKEVKSTEGADNIGEKACRHSASNVTESNACRSNASSSITSPSNASASNASLSITSPSIVGPSNVSPSNVSPKHASASNANASIISPSNASASFISPSNASASFISPSNASASNANPSQATSSNANPSQASSLNSSPSNATPLITLTSPTNASPSDVSLSDVSPSTSNPSVSSTSPQRQYTRHRLLSLRSNCADNDDDLEKQQLPPAPTHSPHVPSPDQNVPKFDPTVLKARLRQLNILRDETFFKNNRNKTVYSYAFKYKNNNTLNRGQLSSKNNNNTKDAADEINMWRSNFEIGTVPPRLTFEVYSETATTQQNAKKEERKKDKKPIPFVFDTFSSWQKEYSRNNVQPTNEQSEPNREDVFFKNDNRSSAYKRATSSSSSNDAVIPTAHQLEENWRRNSISNSQQSNLNSMGVATADDISNNDSEVLNRNFKELMKKLQHNNNEKQTAQSGADGFLNAEISCQQLQYHYIALQQQHQQALLIANLHMKTILNRPDALFLLNSLNRGQISRSGLIIQVANVRLPQRDREAISAVLSFTAAQQQRMETYTKMCAIAHQLQNLNNLIILQQNLAHLQNQKQQQQPLQQLHPPKHPSASNASKYSLSSRIVVGDKSDETLSPTDFIVNSGRNLLKMQKMLQLNAAATVQKQQYEQQAASSTATAAAGFPNLAFMFNGAGGGGGDVGGNKFSLNAMTMPTPNFGDLNSASVLNDLQTQQLLQQLSLPCASGGVNF